LEIKDLYQRLNIPYTEITGDEEGYQKAIAKVITKLTTDKLRN
jgi:hypothetical protein